jgi:hypothetical protein
VAGNGDGKEGDKDENSDEQASGSHTWDELARNDKGGAAGSDEQLALQDNFALEAELQRAMALSEAKIMELYESLELARLEVIRLFWVCARAC